MSESSVKKNFIYNSLYQLLVILLPLITTPYLSRTLGPAGIGEYAYHFSIAKYFVLFAMMGLNNYGNRTIAAVRDDKEKLAAAFSSIYCMQLSISTAVILLYLIYILLVGGNMMTVIMMFYVVSAAFDVNWFFFGIEQFKLTVLRNTIIKLAAVAAIFVFVHQPADAWVYGLIMSLSFIVTQIAIWPFIRRFTHFVKPSVSDVLQHVKPNLVLFIPVIAISLYKYMDKIMLGTMANKMEVGYYESSEKIIDVPVALVTALGTVMLPKMSNLFAKNEKKKGEKYTFYSLLFAVFLSSALSFGIMAVSQDFVPLFFGPGYDTCNLLFAILAPSTIFMAVANVIRTQYLIPMHKDKVYIGSVIIGAVVNLILNAILIPGLQSAGAAIGTLVAEASVCIYQFLLVRKEGNFLEPTTKSLPFVVSGVVMWLLLSLIRFSWNSLILSILVKIVIGVLIYAAALIVIWFILFRFFKVRPGMKKVRKRESSNLR